jgi:hypothetical protein
MEYKETFISIKEEGLQRFLVFDLELFPGVGLMFTEEFGVETHITGFVDTVDISESSGDGKVRANCSERTIHIPDILWLGIQGGIIDTGVVNTYLLFTVKQDNTIFLTTGDSDFHLEPLFHGDGTFKVFLCQCDVLLL